MRNGFLGALFAALGGAGLAAAQYPVAYPPAYPAQVPPGLAGASAFPTFRPAPNLWPVHYGPPMMPVYSPRPVPAWPAVARPMAPAYTPQPVVPPVAQPPANGGDKKPEPIPTPPRPREPVLDPPLPPDPEKAPGCPPVVEGTPLIGDDESCHLPPPERELSHELDPPWHGPRGYCIYGRADFLWWWIRERTAPPLVSTGPLGAPGTTVLVSGLEFDNQERIGSRFTLGTWLGSNSKVGLEVTGLWLAERSPEFGSSAAALARPFRDVTAGAESALVVAGPGAYGGAVAIDALSRLWGGEATLRVELCRLPGFHIDALGGFRYLQIDDSLEIVDRSNFGANLGPLAGTSIVSSDRFGARNQFWGGQLGVEAELSRGRFFVNAATKLALGSTHQTVTINGTTVAQRGAAVLSSPFGLLALPTNIGRYERDEFTVIPEAGFNVGMQLSDHLRLTAGYTFLYVTNVARGGDQIDRSLNLTQVGGSGLTGERRPAFTFRDTDFWAQGLNLGLEFRY